MLATARLRGGRRGLGAAVLFISLLALLLVLQPVASVTADAACNAMPIGLVGAVPSHFGQAVRVDVRDNYAYVVDWRGSLEVFDVGNPCNPISLGSAQWAANEFQDVKAVGDFVYVANDANGLAKYNVTIPAAPVRVAERHDSGGYAVSVDYDDRYLFVSQLYSENPGLVIYDRTTFPNGTPTTYSMGSGYPFMWEVDIEGERAYIFNSGDYITPRLEVLDISTLPEAPILLGSIELPRETYGHGFGLKVAGGYAYLSAPAVESINVDGGLVIINVEDDSNPFVEGMVTIPNAGLNFWKRPGLDVMGEMVYMPGSDGLYGFDVSDPSHPSQTEYYPYPSAFGQVGSGDVAIQGNYAYASLYPPDGNTSYGWGGLAIYKLHQANLAPVAIDDEYVVDEDLTLTAAAPGVLENDSDPENDHLTAVLVDDVSHGMLELNVDGSFIYTPYANYNGPDSFTYQTNDGAANSNVATVNITVNPINDPPVVYWSVSPPSPATLGVTNVAAEVTFSDVDSGDSHTCQWNWGDGTLDGPALCVPGAVAGSHVYFAIGSHTVTMTVTDSGPAVQAVSAPVHVIWPFDGFYAPVNNPPMVNSVKGGSGVPVKFSLGGDYGLDIIAEGYPKSVRVACETGDPTDEVEETVTAGNSSLQYNALTGQYTYVWKTAKVWSGTCRQLQLKLIDGTVHIAGFQFK